MFMKIPSKSYGLLVDVMQKTQTQRTHPFFDMTTNKYSVNLKRLILRNLEIYNYLVL